MRLVWCIFIGVLALATLTHGNACPEHIILKLKETQWARCNEVNGRRMEEIDQKGLDRDEHIRQMCCAISDTGTCWVDSLRSACGSEAADEFIKSFKFKGGCASWTYPESISRCELWYTKWWFITIVAILAIVVIAAVVFVVLKKRAKF